MTTLDLRMPGELRLVLRGATENAILNTLRSWSYWIRVELEPDPADATQYLSVTLITGRNQETTIRDVLRRSFGMTFPPEGGDCVLKAVAAPAPGRRGSSTRRR